MLSSSKRRHTVHTCKEYISRLTGMTGHDLNHNEELVLYCNLRAEKAIYHIQSGLTSGGFYRNRKKARKVLETKNKAHKDNGTVYERSVSGKLHLHVKKSAQASWQVVSCSSKPCKLLCLSIILWQHIIVGM